METLAFLHASINYENPESVTPISHPEGERSPIAQSMVAGMTGGAVVLSAMVMAPGSQAVVQQGDECAAVRSVQTALQQKGYNPGQVDGVFGPTTEVATIEFQRRNNLPADGQVGSKTASALGLRVEDANSPFRDGACGASSGTTTVASAGSSAVASSGSSATSSRSSTVRIKTNGNPLNVRSGPGTNYSVIGVISNGVQVRVSESANGWLRLAERDGWIAAQWTTGSSNGSSSGGGGSSSGGGGSANGNIRVVTNGGPLNIRSGPGTNHGVVGVVANGTVVNTTGRTSGEWIELARGGWVIAQWTNLGGVRQSSGGTAARRAAVSTNGRALNLRSSPNGAVIGTLPNRTGLQLSGRRNGGWAEVVSSDRGQTRGWVSEQWIRYQ
jgi:uncharacterized protein YraI